MKSPLGQVGKVIALLDRGEKRRLLLVFAGSVLMALLGVIGVGSIMPFIAVASKPEIIQTNRYLHWAYAAFGFRSDTGFLIFLGIGVLGFLVLTNVSQALVSYVKTRFTSMRRHSLSLRLMKGYLGQPYPFFLNRNSYEFVKNINGEVGMMINGTLMQFVDLVSNIIQSTLLVAFLFAVNPTSTLGIIVLITILYGGIYVSVRKVLKRLGAERFDLNRERSRIVSEAFWGFKEVKIMGVESVFLDEYAKPSKKLARNESLGEIISDVPRFALDTAAFSGIMAFVLISIVASGGFREAAAAVSLYAYAGYRLIPSVQGTFKGISKLRYGAPAAERMVAEFAIIGHAAAVSRKELRRMGFENSIELDKVTFAYPDVEHPVISDLSLSIRRNSLVGFAGKTGSGKTTLVDIILGLLVPQAGFLKIDGIEINEANRRTWQANLGYVPQVIYLSNDTVAANIAFGVPRDKINMDAVQNAARRAQIHDFIVADMSGSYDTRIGERGIRLSGGQRQRIGIARALYRNPSVLVMDEATSALDTHTEEAVMQAIDALQGTKTIILIAHRLSTLRKCDTIYHLERGKIVDTGRYEELHSRSHYFAR